MELKDFIEKYILTGEDLMKNIDKIEKIILKEITVSSISNDFSSPLGWEVQNMLTVSFLIASSAFKRSESRGVHYRLDYLNTNDKQWKKHITVNNNKKDPEQ